MMPFRKTKDFMKLNNLPAKNHVYTEFNLTDNNAWLMVAFPCLQLYINTT